MLKLLAVEVLTEEEEEEEEEERNTKKTIPCRRKRQGNKNGQSGILIKICTANSKVNQVLPNDALHIRYKYEL